MFFFIFLSYTENTRQQRHREALYTEVHNCGVLAYCESTVCRRGCCMVSERTFKSFLLLWDQGEIKVTGQPTHQAKTILWFSSAATRTGGFSNMWDWALICSTGTPQGTVLSPFLFTLHSFRATSRHAIIRNTLMKVLQWLDVLVMRRKRRKTEQRMILVWNVLNVDKIGEMVINFICREEDSYIKPYKVLFYFNWALKASSLVHPITHFILSSIYLILSYLKFMHTYNTGVNSTFWPSVLWHAAWRRLYTSN